MDEGDREIEEHEVQGGAKINEKTRKNRGDFPQDHEEHRGIQGTSRGNDRNTMNCTRSDTTVTNCTKNTKKKRPCKRRLGAGMALLGGRSGHMDPPHHAYARFPRSARRTSPLFRGVPRMIAPESASRP